MARFLITSLVLTIALNLAIRLVPGLPERLGRWMAHLGSPAPPPPPPPGPDGPAPPDGRPARRVRVYAPWKAMIVGSIVLTVALNLIARLLR